MVVKSKDMIEGNEILIFDASAVYLPEEKGQAGFRIFGQQRLKRFGFNLQQNKDSQGGDVLVFNEGKTIIPFQTNSGILTLKTHQRNLSNNLRKRVEKAIESALNGDDDGDFCINASTSLLMNEANLTQVERDRLHHWRIGHRSAKNSKLNENCPVCNEGKKKIGSFKRNYEFIGNTKGPLQHYWRLYCDGYGGPRSLGD
jgi:hypothetical protein